MTNPAGGTSVLVLGATGFIGTWLHRCLLDAGHEVVGASPYRHRPESLFVLGDREAHVEHWDASTESLHRIIEAHRPEAVVHLEACVDPVVLRERPSYAIERNLLQTVNVLEACRTFGVARVVLASTVAVLPSIRYQPIDAAHPIITGTEGPAGGPARRERPPARHRRGDRRDRPRRRRALVASVGTGTSLWVTSACYAVAFLALTTLLRAGSGAEGVGGTRPEGTSETAAPQPARSTLGDLGAGFASLRRDPFLLRVLVLISAAGLALSGPITVGVPWLARAEFGVDAAAFGLMLAMWTAGSLLGVLLAGSLSNAPSWRALVTVVSVVLTAALVTLGVVRELPVAAMSLLVMGTAAGSFNVFLITWLQERTDPAVLGRLMSFAELAEVITAPASYLLAGPLLDVSVTGLFIGAAVILLLSALAVVASGHADGDRAEPLETSADGMGRLTASTGRAAQPGDEGRRGDGA